jgi:hypothetical protein
MLKCDEPLSNSGYTFNVRPSMMARQLSRSLKLFSFIDILLCIIYVYQFQFFAAIAIIGPICGYYGRD